MSKLNAIDVKSIHKLCSGQVMLDMSSVIKELIENSIDAGATNIEIRFKGNGSTMIEVIDNGSGICEQDFEYIGKRYYTSKIDNFEDILKIKSLGFRGEAINSLCAVANVTFFTSTKQSAPMGTKIVFDNFGNIIDKTNIARQNGTTVLVSNLFKSFPVRYKDLLRNIKKVYTKCLATIQSYALISTDIRFKVINFDLKGKPNQVLFTNPTNCIMSNFIGLFGTSSSSNLTKFEFKFIINYKSKDNNQQQIQLENKMYGIISKGTSGSGRTSSDKQFIYINNRPCTLSKLNKVINEVYKLRNPNQFPIVVGNLILDPNHYDVNLTPDKKTILLENENCIIQKVKECFIEFFDSQQANIPINQFNGNAREESNNKITNLDTSKASNISQAATELRINFPINNKPSVEPISNVFSNTALNNISSNTGTLIKQEEDFTLFPNNSECNKPHVHSRDAILTNINSETIQSSRIVDMELENPTKRIKEYQVNLIDPKDITEVNEDNLLLSKPIVPYDPNSFILENNSNQSVDFTPKMKAYVIDESGLSLSWTMEDLIDNTHTKEEEKIKEVVIEQVELIDNHLSLSPQEDFKSMKIIGQFNLGFIITQLENQLFIIDQHAADEIYNYTKLHQSLNEQIPRQPLAYPKELHLSIQEEMIAIENLNYLKAQGYELIYQADALAGKRLKLISIPLTNTVTFKLEDLEHLIHSLINNPILNPTKYSIIKFQNGLASKGSKLDFKLASKACRKSVMIGDHLKVDKMVKIIRNLADLPLPWNCPHGRPTLRHLVTLPKN